jgi:membrane associated rhomboid family serine protease
LGNFANATIRPNDHNSLGASTAVFAALGMVAMAERRLSPDPNTSRIRRWSPIISAILLFAWIGLGGPQTDVLAHLTGLGSGMILGGFIGAPPEKRRVRTPLQEVKYGVVAVLVIALCWVVAIAFQ